MLTKESYHKLCTLSHYDGQSRLGGDLKKKEMFTLRNISYCRLKLRAPGRCTIITTSGSPGRLQCDPQLPHARDERDAKTLHDVPTYSGISRNPYGYCKVASSIDVKLSRIPVSYATFFMASSRCVRRPLSSRGFMPSKSEKGKRPCPGLKPRSGASIKRLTNEYKYLVFIKHTWRVEHSPSNFSL